MAGYLDHYGEGFEQHAKRNKLIVAIVLIALFGGGGIFSGGPGASLADRCAVP